jgi:hypothetical protein
MNQVAFGVIDIEGFIFKDIPDVISVLKTTYNNIIPK